MGTRTGKVDHIFCDGDDSLDVAEGLVGAVFDREILDDGITS